MLRLDQPKLVLLLLSTRLAGLASATAVDPQRVLAAPGNNEQPQHQGYAQSQIAGSDDDDSDIFAALEAHDDPVDAYVSLNPDAAFTLAQPRLLQVFGEQEQWMTEGDKMRLHRQGKKFIDLTDHQDFYESNDVNANAGNARK
jgi:hypothetical protein